MAHPSHYSPVIDRFLVSVLYFDAKRHGLPMTRRLNELLRDALEGSAAWKEAQESWSQAGNQPNGTSPATPVG